MKEVKFGMGFIITEMEVQDREPNADIWQKGQHAR